MVAHPTELKGILTMRDYTISTRALTIIAVISVLLALVMAGLNVWQDQKNWEAQWIGRYPMTNQNIEWTGAGYQPIVTPEE